MEQPDFNNRLLKAIYCQGEPDRVPMVEAGIATSIKERFLGRKITSLQDEIEFWETAGYDFIPLEAGLRTIIDAAIHHEGTGRFESATPDSPKVAQAKEFAINQLSKFQLTTVNEDGSLRSWAPEGKGFINCIEDLEAFPWPSPEDMDYSEFETIKGLLPPGMGVFCYAGAIFSSLMLMMGLEECFIGMTRGSELFTQLLKKVGEFQVKVVEILLETGSVGGIWINDDMGFQTGPLVAPKLYQKYTFPYYREIKHLVASKGIPLLLHSDGNITKILPDLAEIGFNAIHPIQPECMDILQARQILGDKVCVIGNLSLGYPLGTGTPEDVVKEADLLIRKLAPGGGYCFSSGNSIPDYIPYENWLAMRDTALRVGIYPIKVSSATA
jgi:uroporphyrinogen decarboxylase